jgi:UDP-N-acetylmuramate--alanine ligase
MSSIQHQPLFGRVRHLHFVGIGGIGMSGMAEILLHQGFTISGSDESLGETTERLSKLGATIFKGHLATNIEGADVVVYTSAVYAEDNVETREALARKIPVIKRSEMLAELMRMKYGIAIAGTHGKTTTTTITGMVVMQGGFDPTIMVGGRVHSFDQTNAVVGKGDIMIVEADEYDRTFLKLSPSLVVITNIDTDHLDIYADIDDIKAAFVEFASKVPFYGALVVCLDDPMVRSILPKISRRTLTYGLTPQAQLRATDIITDGMSSRFHVQLNREDLGEVTLQVPGEHNVRNALGAIGIGLEIGMPFADIALGISHFSGVMRRFQVKGTAQDVVVIDDYAHHPTEVQATLQAARAGWKDNRIVAVFQPHLFSRTRDLFNEFGSSFFDADVLLVTDVYPSREQPIEGISGKLIADTASDFGHQQVIYVPNKKDVPKHLHTITKPGDVVITMGAGDIYRFGEEYLNDLQQGKGASSN